MFQRFISSSPIDSEVMDLIERGRQHMAFPRLPATLTAGGIGVWGNFAYPNLANDQRLDLLRYGGLADVADGARCAGDVFDDLRVGVDCLGHRSLSGEDQHAPCRAVSGV